MRGKLKDVLLSEINNQDPKLVEESLVENFQEGIEQVKQNSEENFKELESCIDRSFSELSSYVENNQNEIKEIFKEVVRHHQAASQERQEIANCVEEGRKENREGIKQIIQMLNEAMTGQESKKVRRPIWFDVRESVQLFTGRQEQLDQIATAIKQGIIVISGLGGVGKSELAIKYARSHYSTEDSVTWINAEKLQGFLSRLLKGLGLKTKDQDGDEESVGLMVYDSSPHSRLG